MVHGASMGRVPPWSIAEGEAAAEPASAWPAQQPIVGRPVQRASPMEPVAQGVLVESAVERAGAARAAAVSESMGALAA